METCIHCGGEVYLMYYKPTGTEGDIQQVTGMLWALDQSGDPNEDFICPDRETSGSWPNGKPHEVGNP